MPEFTAKSWFLTGPTAVGKSEIAIFVALETGAEIVALDSMTFYRGLDIGTAKPSAADRERVPHHLVDCLEPDQPANVDWFLERAGLAAAEILDRGRRPLFVGGSPLYLKALLRGLLDGPPPNVEFRRRLEAEAEHFGSGRLHATLAAVDPEAAARIHSNDSRRIIRALEVFEATGIPISRLQEQFDKPVHPQPKVACLVRPRESLYDRIDRRVIDMLESGWIDEVRQLRADGRFLGREASQAVGYRELGMYLDGKIEFESMVATIQRRTRRFAKHQMTWFRHLEEVRFFEVQDRTTSEVATELLEYFQS